MQICGVYIELFRASGWDIEKEGDPVTPEDIRKARRSVSVHLGRVADSLEKAIAGGWSTQRLEHGIQLKKMAIETNEEARRDLAACGVDMDLVVPTRTIVLPANLRYEQAINIVANTAIGELTRLQSCNLSRIGEILDRVLHTWGFRENLYYRHKHAQSKPKNRRQLIEFMAG